MSLHSLNQNKWKKIIKTKSKILLKKKKNFKEIQRFMLRKPQRRNIIIKFNLIKLSNNSKNKTKLISNK